MRLTKNRNVANLAPSPCHICLQNGKDCGGCGRWEVWFRRWWPIVCEPFRKIEWVAANNGEVEETNDADDNAGGEQK